MLDTVIVSKYLYPLPTDETVILETVLFNTVKFNVAPLPEPLVVVAILV